MLVWQNKLILVLGLFLAITGVARGAPDIVQALTVERTEAAPVIVQAPNQPEPSLGPARDEIVGEVDEMVTERVNGLSLSFTGKRTGRPVDSSNQTPVSQAEWLGGVFYTDLEEATANKNGRPRNELGEAPVRLVIPSIELDAPVIPAEASVVTIKDRAYLQWLAPNHFSTGWHTDSAYLSTVGNTVINGHHNQFGEVFVRLVDLMVGDVIEVHSDTQMYRYVVANTMILPEKHAKLAERLENARWILPSNDERLTLITCWPYQTNTHRLIVVASPISTGD